MNITLRQIRAFVAVAQTGSFTAAANQLHLTQSAVSVLISEFEQQFGLRLFDRTTRSVQLNDAGRDFFPVAEKVLVDLRNAVLGSQDLVAKKRGRVIVATSSLMASILLPSAIAEYTAMYPGITIVVKDTIAGLIQSQVRDREVDFGIGTFDKSGREVVADLLMADTLVLACPSGHVLSRKAKVAWRDLAGHDFIAINRESSVGELIKSHLDGLNVDIHTTYEVSYLATVAGLVGAGLGVSVLPSYAVPITRMYDIQVKKLVEPIVRREISFLIRKGQVLSPAAESFRNHIREHIKRIK